MHCVVSPFIACGVEIFSYKGELHHNINCKYTSLVCMLCFLNVGKFLSKCGREPEKVEGKRQLFSNSRGKVLQ